MEMFFHPFVGSKYNNEGFEGKKILVLGESHYCSDQCEECGTIKSNECNNFTNIVLNKFINYKEGKDPFENWMKTFTKFANIFTGKKLTQSEIIEFYNSIIFYNFVQFAICGPRVSPTEKQFDDSMPAFLEVLAKYKPDLIIIWGERLWDNIQNIGRWGNEVYLSSNVLKPYYFTVDNQEIPAFHIYHPSSSNFNNDFTIYIKESISFLTNSLPTNS